jgi:hypothetical protein
MHPRQAGQFTANQLKDLRRSQPRDQEPKLPLRGRGRGGAAHVTAGPDPLDQALLLPIPERADQGRPGDLEPQCQFLIAR